MIKAIAFDLDDTLLDTTGLLVKKASAEAFEILIQNGLRLNLKQCENLRLELIKQMSHKEVFEKLASEYGTEQTQKASIQAVQRFYEPHLPPHLPLLEGAKENLLYLKPKYKLYLVTAGHEKAQRQKAQALGINPFFEKIYVINSLEKKRKHSAFLEIITINNLQPHELLCVGNSLSSEIQDGLKIGATTCYFEFGEDRGTQLSTDLNFKPTYHIHHHSELIKVCQL